MMNLIYILLNKTLGEQHHLTEYFQSESKQAKWNIGLYSTIALANLLIDLLVINNLILTATLTVLILTPAMLINVIYLIMERGGLKSNKESTSFFTRHKSSKVDLKRHTFALSNLAVACTLGFVIICFTFKAYDSIPDFSGCYTLIDDEEIIPPVTKTPPPPPPPAPEIVKIEIVEDDEEIDDTEIEDIIEDLDDFEVPDEVVIDEPDIEWVSFPDQFPEFIGGVGKMMQYLVSNINYPSYAVEMGIEGVVIVTFNVDQKGSISNVQIARGIGGGCDEEAKRVVQAMPNWLPGTQNGKPVGVKYNIPVKFTLSN